MTPLVEKVANIGRPVSLAAVITEPAQSGPGRAAFILLNSGVMHHVGTCGLSVKLARQIAREAGLLSVRFDFSSIGDSGSRGSNASLDQLAVAETIEVLDYIEQYYGIRRFILCGLCSGAHNAFSAALQDERVSGLVLYDHYCYPTWKSYLYFYGPRLFKSKHWVSTASRAMEKLRGHSGNDSEASNGIDNRFVEQPLFAAKPDKQLMQADLCSLVDRRVSMLFAFTGNDHLDYMYQQQYVDCFSGVNFAQLLTVEHYPTATHIFTEPHYQRQLIEHTVAWTKDL